MSELLPTGTELAVCRDIAERQQKGIAKYGSTVANNPLELREWLQHAYEELLDAPIYLKRAIDDIDATQYQPKPENIEKALSHIAISLTKECALHDLNVAQFYLSKEIIALEDKQKTP